MCDPRLTRLADVVVNHCASVKPDELVVIRAGPQSMTAVEEMFKAVLKAGGHPSYSVRSESLQELLLRHANDRQLQHACPFEGHHLSACDVLIVLSQPLNTRCLTSVEPARSAMYQAARRAGLSKGLKQLAAGKSRYVLTEAPGNAAAQEAEMSLTEYSDFVYRAGFLHLPDPVAAWRQFYQLQEKCVDYLNQKTVLRFESPPNQDSALDRLHDGTDITVDVSGRTWLNRADGENFPDGELDSGPRNVDGILNLTHPAIYHGKQVEGIRLEFRGGKVVAASATRNQDYLIALLDSDSGARIAGEVGIGTNYHLTRFINNTFFDEKIGGTFHLALGAGYPQTGNANESCIHWDLVSDLRNGGSITADGELIQKDGRFLLEGWPGHAQ